ncbi:serine hydrolase [Hamadaea sp. NPDC051192]|uniref:serine hydrolase n=1 Tax=Hamadaea sp. NPDC051192 TaxID=3154940 RepID=UPI0034372352
MIDTAAVETALSAYIDARGGDAAIAVYDRTTGTSVSVGGSAEFQTASIVKVDIIAALMLQRQADGESLSSQEKAWAEAAITASDNDSATALFKAIGGRSGLAAANTTLGLTETTPSSSWGMTTTTVDDQVRLLNAVSDTDGPLSAANRALLQGWMANVIDEQRFGVTVGATSAASAVYVKVGWVDLDDEGGLYATNSVGRIVEDDHDWVIAVLSDHNQSLGTGRTLVDGIVTTAMGLLRSSDG